MNQKIKNEKLQSLCEQLNDMSLSERIDAISCVNKLTTLDYEEEEISIVCNSETELHTRARSCAKEPETIDWLKLYFKEDSVLYDIGANIGAYSLVAGKMNDKGLIFSFEPGYASFSSLISNININELTDRIMPISMAVSNNNSLDYFNYVTNEAGCASNSFGESIDYLGNQFVPHYKQMISSMTLDSVIDFIEPPTMIKIDVDGIEDKIIEGARKTLTEGNVETVLVELVDGDDDRAKSVLSNMELYGYKIDSVHPYKGVSSTSNYIFVKK
jgi:FkbM family methyltransferase